MKYLMTIIIRTELNHSKMNTCGSQAYICNSKLMMSHSNSSQEFTYRKYQVESH